MKHINIVRLWESKQKTITYVLLLTYIYRTLSIQRAYVEGIQTKYLKLIYVLKLNSKLPIGTTKLMNFQLFEY